MRFVIFALFVSAVFGITLKDCKRNGKHNDGTKYYPWTSGGFDHNEINSTHTYAEWDLCDDQKFPLCLYTNEFMKTSKIDDLSTRQFHCFQCRKNCDCPVGKYCFVGGEYNDYNHEHFGTCQSYTSRLGKGCDSSLSSASAHATPRNQDRKSGFYGQKLACAIFHKYNLYDHHDTNFTTAQTLWHGPCIHGKCRDCNSGPRPYKFWDKLSGDKHMAVCDEATSVYSNSINREGPKECRNHKIIKGSLKGCTVFSDASTAALSVVALAAALVVAL